jgi:hypothetical protein
MEVIHFLTNVHIEYKSNILRFYTEEKVNFMLAIALNLSAFKIKQMLSLPGNILLPWLKYKYKCTFQGYRGI